MPGIVHKTGKTLPVGGTPPALVSVYGLRRSSVSPLFITDVSPEFIKGHRRRGGMAPALPRWTGSGLLAALACNRVERLEPLPLETWLAKRRSWLLAALWMIPALSWRLAAENIRLNRLFSISGY